MANLKINTDSAITAATHIKTINGQIRDGFSSVQNAITQLDNAWDGSAATNAIGKFNELKTKYPQARYNVVDNFVTFLFQQVGEGYIQTEEANKSLAEAFK
jgi:hypothetical protein